MMLPWKKPDQAPEDHALVLIIINGKIAADVFVYFEKRLVFITHSLHGKGNATKIVENKVKLSEIEAWIGTGELPLPDWATPRA